MGLTYPACLRHGVSAARPGAALPRGRPHGLDSACPHRRGLRRDKIWDSGGSPSDGRVPTGCSRGGISPFGEAHPALAAFADPTLVSGSGIGPASCFLASRFRSRSSASQRTLLIGVGILGGLGRGGPRDVDRLPGWTSGRVVPTRSTTERAAAGLRLAARLTHGPLQSPGCPRSLSALPRRGNQAQTYDVAGARRLPSLILIYEPRTKRTRSSGRTHPKAVISVTDSSGSMTFRAGAYAPCCRQGHDRRPRYEA